MRIVDKPHWHSVLALIVGVVALDWISYIYSLRGLNITPWNPAPALGLLFLMRYGRHAFVPLMAALLLADAYVRSLPVPFFLSLGLIVLLTVGYWAIAEVLRQRLAHRNIFYDRKGLFEWALVVTIGTFVNSGVYVAALVAGGVLPDGVALVAFVRYWIGDCVGILVSMPIMWMLSEEQERMLLRATVLRWETLIYVFGIAAALWVAFGIGSTADFKYFYVLFLPVVWAAARQGLAGAVVSAGILQIGIICLVRWFGISVVTVQEIQALSAVLALFGFFLGVVMDERQRISDDLRQSLRLVAAGEMAGALAHELNQPLTALSVYGTACRYLLEQGNTGEQLQNAIRGMIAESVRASDVVRRLRDFFKTGATQLESISLESLLEASTARFSQKAPERGVELVVDAPPRCRLFADRLQLEVVLRNLLSNAFDAVAERPQGQRRVHVSSHLVGGGRLSIVVEDSGPGLSGTVAAKMFEAFQSSKTSGLGLGLAISRAIVEAHGGHIIAEVTDHGVFKLELPIDERGEDAV